MEGQEINITIDITANHNGYFEFRLCQNDESMKKVDQVCFDKNMLLVLDNNEKDAQRITDPELNSLDFSFLFFFVFSWFTKIVFSL